jgi:hypothetical protein
VKLPYGQTVTVLRRPAVDRTGDGGATVSHTISQCAIVWDSTTNDDDRRDTSITFVDVYVPVGADILASDQVELPDGSVGAVFGRPRWGEPHPMTGWQSGYKLVRLKVVA